MVSKLVTGDFWMLSVISTPPRAPRYNDGHMSFKQFVRFLTDFELLPNVLSLHVADQCPRPWSEAVEALARPRMAPGSECQKKWSTIHAEIESHFG